MYRINHANIKDWAANYEGPLFDGILCDPPYELGFMGKSWDSSGIAFDTEMWADLFKLIKPGGHLLAFSGSRTYHRMAVAIEDAGFEIRDMIEWIYGSGFPKSLNIGKAVDKLQGNERESIADPEAGRRNKSVSKFANTYGDIEDKTDFVTKGTSPYEGYGTALKPAHEPCVLARKPLEGTVANNVLKHGTGGLNIDGTRVAGDMGADRALGKPRIDTDKYGKANPTLNPQSPLGRFPANLIHDGSDEVEAVFPQSKSPATYNRKTPAVSGHFSGPVTKETTAVNFGDSGSAARFFKVCKQGEEDEYKSIHEVDSDITKTQGEQKEPNKKTKPSHYQSDNILTAEHKGLKYSPKASKSERNAGLEGFEERLVFNNDKGDGLGRGISNTKHPSANHHPTVKPLSLTKYLATLIKPPTGGRLLVPFSGSGSEMIGALQAGWEYVEGVELTEEYIPIAEARIEHWLAQMNKQLEIL